MQKLIPTFLERNNMGTRCLTVVEEYNDEVLVMYRQMDGYPDGHGVDLAKFLSEFTVVDGLRLNDPRKTANGAGCLAGQIVAYFKSGAGGFYLYPSGTRDVGEEYIYKVKTETDKPINIIIIDVYEGGVIFDGTPEELLERWE